MLMQGRCCVISNESIFTLSLSSKVTASFFSFSFNPAILASYRCTVSSFLKEFLLSCCENEIFVTINAFYLFTFHTLSSSQRRIPSIIFFIFLYIYFFDTFKEWHLGHRRFFPIPLNSFPQSLHTYSLIVVSPEISTSNISPTLHMLITSFDDS